MRKGTIASLLVVAILASAGAGYFLGINSVAGRLVVTGPLSTLGTNESCAFPTGNSGGIGLQLTNRSTPVVNATISARGWEIDITLL
jgi:hypothetical protein